MMEMGGVLRPGRSRSGVLVTIAAVVLTIALALSAPGPLREPGAALGPGGGPLVPTGYHRVPLDSNGVVASQSAIPNPLPTVYGNASFELPAFAGLAGYVNVTGADSAETNGAQVPIVSWTADGVFYVNLSNDLVFYNFATDTVTEIAAWTPLYEDLMDYNGMANTEYITQDGTEIYSIGCPTSCQSDPQPDVEVEVANVSTGQVWIYPFVGLTFSTVGGLGNTEKNVQPLLIGLNGSDTEAVIVDEEGVMYGVPVGSPASTPPRELTNLLFFEANNLDWMPSLNSFINEEAGGSLSDEWQQLLWNGQTVTDAMTGSWGAGIKSEFADAGGYNLTAGQWSLTAGNCSGRGRHHRIHPDRRGSRGRVRDVGGSRPGQLLPLRSAPPAPGPERDVRGGRGRVRPGPHHGGRPVRGRSVEQHLRDPEPGHGGVVVPRRRGQPRDLRAVRHLQYGQLVP